MTPTILLNHAIDWQMTSALSLSVTGRYVGRSFLANTGDARFMTPPAHLLDAGVAWRRGRNELALNVLNVGSTRFYAAGYTDGTTPYYFITAPRAVFVTATLAF